MKEEGQGSFDLRKKSKNATIEKKVEKIAFMGGPYEGHELSHVALYDTKDLRGEGGVKSVRPRQKKQNA